MPKTKISEFSATPGNNTDIDGINIAEGCAPSGINDAIRELMSQLKDFQAGTAGDSFNGPVGTTTAAAGAFTTLSASGAVTLSGGTANGVAYLNGSKVLTTGSALTFDGGANLSTGGSNASTYNTLNVNNTASNGYSRLLFNIGASGANGVGAIKYAPGIFFSIGTDSDASSTPMTFNLNGSEQMRLTSTGLGIGTSSPNRKLEVNGISRFTDGTTNFEIACGGGVAYAGPQTNSPLAFQTNNTERMRLDTSGNLGLGVTPSAWTAFSAFQLQRGSVAANSGELDVSHNAYFDGAWKYIANGFATNHYQASGTYVWRTAPSGTAGNAISFTQAMTLDASGNLVIGSTSATAALDVYRASDAYMALRTGSAELTFNTGAGFTGSTATSIWNKSAIPMVFGTNNTERARIDSSGNLLVGQSSTTTPGLSNTTNGFSVRSIGDGFFSASGTTALYANRNTNDGSVVSLRRGGTEVGTISVTGSATAYNTSSDYRLKENIQPMTGALAKVALLKPCTYNWKVDGSEGEGFIAHELAEVVPQCVTGEKDAVDTEGKPVYQGIDTSFLVATLAAAIQEQQAMIQQLQAEVAALKGN